MFQEYSNWYRQLKAPRHLEWKPWLGSVAVELEYAHGCTKDYIVTPLHANLIIHFDGIDLWHARDLACRCNIAEAHVRKIMARWVNYGIVTELQLGLYGVAKWLATRQPSYLDFEDDILLRCNSSESESGRVRRLCTPYIVGMLTNLGSLDLDQIHNLLRMFVGHNGDCGPISTDSLAALLADLCHEDVLEPVAGRFRLRDHDKSRLA